MKNNSSRLISLFLFAVLLSVPEFAFSQFATTFASLGGSRRSDFFNSIRKSKREADKRGLPTVGSIYINEKFKPCKIYYKDELIGDFLYRHNAFNDEIEIRSTNVADTTVSSLIIVRNIWVEDGETNKKMGVMTFQNDEETLRNGYLYPIVDNGKYQLYFKNQVKFTEGTIPANSFVRPTPNRFTHFRRYFLKLDDNPVAFRIDKSKSSLLKHLNKEQKEQAKTFMKENKISFKDEEDLAELINFLNSL